MVHHRKYPLFTYYLYLGVNVYQNVAQYLLHNMTYAPEKFEVGIPMVKENMQLQDNTNLTLTLGSRSNKMLFDAPPPNRMIYALAIIEIAMSNRSGEDAFTRKVQKGTLLDVDLEIKVTQNVAQYPLHHVSYSP